MARKTPKNNILWHVKIRNSDFIPKIASYWHSHACLHVLIVALPSAKHCTEITRSTGQTFTEMVFWCHPLPSLWVSSPEWNLKSQSPLPALWVHFFPCVHQDTSSVMLALGGPTWHPLCPRKHCCPPALVQGLSLRPQSHDFTHVRSQAISPFSPDSVKCHPSKSLFFSAPSPITPFIACLFPSLHVCLLISCHPHHINFIWAENILDAQWLFANEWIIIVAFSWLKSCVSISLAGWQPSQNWDNSCKLLPQHFVLLGSIAVRCTHGEFIS